MAFKGWDKVAITRDCGVRVEGIAPVIISASRSTDIPGCYGEWFINRLRKGYIVWINPFNGEKYYVSFEKTRCIVFWTKNPEPFLKYIENIQKMGIGVLFQVTVNDYEVDGFEINIPSLKERIKSVKELAAKIGKDKVLWRFDPLILTDHISCAKLIEKINNVGNQIFEYTERLTISFLSHYKKVVRNLNTMGIKAQDFTDNQKFEIAAKIQKLNEEWGLNVVTCAELLDLSMYGITHGSCIDPVLISRCFGSDPKIRELFGISESVDLFGNIKQTFNKVGDPGQRKLCLCTVSKDVGMYNTCNHGCIYCYANTSPVKTMHSHIKDCNDELLSLK